MRNWIRFFLGTPQRFLGTAVGLLVLSAIADPSIPVHVFNSLSTAFMPLVEPVLRIVLTVGIIWVGIRIIISAFSGKR